MANLAELKVHIGTDISDLADGMKSAGQKVSDFGKGMQTMGGKLTKMATLPLVGVGVGALKMASDVQEMEGKFATVFADLGGEAEAWAATHADAANRSKYDLMGYMATLQDTFVPMGVARDEAFDLAKGITELGVDLASFNNMDESEAIERLTSAMTGNHENLRAFGVVINDAALSAELMAMGIEGGSKAATEAEKMQARYNLVMAGTVDAQGDAIRTSDSFANQMRGMKASAEEAAIGIGQQLLPMATSLVEKVTPWIEKFSNLSESHKKLIVMFGAVAAAAGPVIFIAGTMVRSLGEIAKGFSAVAGAAPKVMSAASTVVSSAGRAVAAMGQWIAAGARWVAQTTAQAARSAASFVASTARMIAAGATWVAQQVAQGARAVASMAVTTAQFIAHYARLAAQSMVNAVRMAASWVVAMGPVAWVIAGVVALVALIIANWEKVSAFTKAAWTALTGFVVGAATSIRDKVVSTFTGLRDRVVSTIQALMDRVRAIKDAIVGFFSGAGQWLVNAGKNIIMGLVNGIKATIGKAVDAVRGGVQKIRNLLPFSPAKDGPLSGRGAPDVAGAKIGEMLASGMRSQVGVVSAAGSTLAGAAVPGLSMPGVRPLAKGGDGATAGPTRVVLVVGDREFDAYVDERSDGRIKDSYRDIRHHARGGGRLPWQERGSVDA